MVSSVTSSAGFSTAMLSGSQCRGPRGSESQQADKAALQEKLFSKLDVNADGGVDKSELNDFLSYAAAATGSTSATSSADLFKTIDSDGDGSISKTEMADGAKSLFDELRTQLMSKSGEAAPPPPPPAEDSDDQQQLFAQIDADGNGSLDQTELGTFLEQTKPQGPPPSGGPGGGGRFSMIQSLLDQYRSTSTDSTTESTTSSLSIAA
jgi:Ca2+-binding EF-hand superfamily protein